MPKVVKTSKVWDFTVQKVQMLLPTPDGGVKPSGMFATVRTDTNEALATVSENRYGILQNGSFVDQIRASLAAVGLDSYKEKLRAVDGGRRFYATYNFPKKVTTMPNKVGDKVSMTLQFANSFDCSIQAQTALLAEILRCLNGMILPQREFSLYRRHDNSIDPSFVQEVIIKAAQSWDSGMDAFSRMAQVAITDEEGVNTLSRLGFAKRMADKIAAIWIDPDFAESKARTLYALYDAITQYLTHEVENNDKAPRLELAQRRNRGAVMRLAKMVHDGEYFAEMVKAIPVEVVAQEVTED